MTLKRGQHSKYPPFAFTEQGVAMLSSVLNSDQAIKVNISIIRTFTHLRKMIVSHEDLRGKIEAIEIQTVGFHLTSRCNDMFWSISACHVEAGSTEEKSVFVCVGLWLLENRIVFEAII